MIQALRAVVTRELRAVQRQLEAYPDEASVWQEIEGAPNTGGTLALHLAGNVQHFFGAVLGGTGFKRDRDSEFSRRDVPRRELLAGIDAAIAAVEHTLTRIRDESLDAPYPEPIAKRRLPTGLFLLHLSNHLAYHLGQLDYHRRGVTRDARGVDAVSVRELPEV